MRELNFSRNRLALIAGENALRLRELSMLRKAEIATPAHLHVSTWPWGRVRGVRVRVRTPCPHAWRTPAPTQSSSRPRMESLTV